MDWLETVVLALLQGLTEFLPISSSAHLILVPRVVDWPDQGLAFDVAVHLGTLAAVMLYFRGELMLMARDWFGHLLGKGKTAESNLAWAVLFGTIPVGLAGLLGADLVETYLRSPLVIAATTIGFGLLLWLAEARSTHQRDEHSLTWKDILVVGCAQALALIPGTSRSGITMTAALFLGLTADGAARFSFLLSIPVIILAGGYETQKLIEATDPVDWNALILGTLISALSAYLCIHYFLKLLARIGLLPFVAYRLVLGAVLLVIFV